MIGRAMDRGSRVCAAVERSSGWWSESCAGVGCSSDAINGPSCQRFSLSQVRALHIPLCEPPFEFASLKLPVNFHAGLPGEPGPAEGHLAEGLQCLGSISSTRPTRRCAMSCALLLTLLHTQCLGSCEHIPGSQYGSHHFWRFQACFSMDPG